MATRSLAYTALVLQVPLDCCSLLALSRIGDGIVPTVRGLSSLASLQHRPERMFSIVIESCRLYRQGVCLHWVSRKSRLIQSVIVALVHHFKRPVSATTLMAMTPCIPHPPQSAGYTRCFNIQRSVFTTNLLARA